MFILENDPKNQKINRNEIKVNTHSPRNHGIIEEGQSTSENNQKHKEEQDKQQHVLEHEFYIDEYSFIQLYKEKRNKDEQRLLGLSKNDESNQQDFVSSQKNNKIEYDKTNHDKIDLHRKKCINKAREKNFDKEVHKQYLEEQNKFETEQPTILMHHKPAILLIQNKETHVLKIDHDIQQNVEPDLKKHHYKAESEKKKSFSDRFETKPIIDAEIYWATKEQNKANRNNSVSNIKQFYDQMNSPSNLETFLKNNRIEKEGYDGEESENIEKIMHDGYNYKNRNKVRFMEPLMPSTNVNHHRVLSNGNIHDKNQTMNLNDNLHAYKNEDNPLKLKNNDQFFYDYHKIDPSRFIYIKKKNSHR